MRKLLLFILILLFFGISNSFAGWYPAPSKYYGLGRTACTGDGLGGGYDSTAALAGPVNLYAPSSGWMNCSYWDGIIPVATITPSTTAWTNGNVTLTVGCSDTGGSGCNTYSATYSPIFHLANNFTVTSNGTYYGAYYDNAWNFSGWKPYTVSNIDKTPPTGTVSYSTSGWTNQNVVVTAHCSDTGGSGCSAATFSKIVSSNGVGNIIISDRAGNTQLIAYNVTNIDKTVPTVTNNYSFNNVWKSLGSQTITLSVSDTNLITIPGHWGRNWYGRAYWVFGYSYNGLPSGISTTKWCVGSTCNPSTGTVGTSITKTAPYNNTIRYQTWDVAGNASAIGSFVLKLDTRPPTNPTYFSYSATNSNGTSCNGIYCRTSSIAVNYSWGGASDTGGSGLKDYQVVFQRGSNWSWVNSLWVAGASTYLVYSGLTNGRYYVRIRSRDNVLNTPGIHFLGGAIVIDTTPPTGTVSYSTSGWTNQNVVVTAYCSDTGGSGCAQTTYSTTVSSNGAGNITISDRAGNTQLIAYNVGNIDKIAPTVMNNYSFNNVWKSLGSQTITLSPVDTGGSGISTTKWCEGAGCTPGTVGTSITKTAPYNNTIRYQTWDVAGNASAIGGFVVKLDITKPIISDIGNTTPANNSNLLATTSQAISVGVGVNGGSPIVSIIGNIEDYNNQNTTTTVSSSNGTLPFNWDIRNVDRKIQLPSPSGVFTRLPNGSRQYTFKITQIRDQAGNIWNGNKTFNYNVYANPNTMIGLRQGTKVINLSDVNSLKAINVANGTSHPLNITIKDFYGNQIVPASGINRKIDFVFDVIDSTNLNQYSTTSNNSAVFLSTPSTPSSYNNINANRFPNQWSSNGIYPFNFKVYAPTYSGSATDGRQYVNGNFHINNIKVDIVGNLSSNTSLPLDNSSNIDFQFKPLYKAKIIGDIQKYGFIEGATQTGVINITKNGIKTTTNNNLFLEFGSGTSQQSTSFDMIYYKQGGLTGSLMNSLTSVSRNLINNYPLKTLLTQKVLLSNLSSSYLSTHIGYTINGKNIVYNQDIIGKRRYSSASTTNTITQVGLKVLGKTFSDKKTNITQTQQASNFNILGNISKASLRRDIVKNAYNIIRNAPLSNGNKKIDKLSSLGWTNTDGKKLQNDKILYFGGLNGSNVTLDLSQRLMNIKLQGKKTIIVKGGNLYIKSNIVNKNNNDILGIIVLKDISGSGGYIYIDPSVTEIDAIMYASRSVISYDSLHLPSPILNGTTSQSILRNQLYIKGSIFSYNTIGGSRANPIICPYYITGLCDRIIAQTYDFNYLRRYFLYDTTGNLIGDTPANGGSSVLQPTDPNYKYPIVIEYNPVVQTGPPPLFYK